MTAAPSVLIAVTTYRRAEVLPELVASIRAQQDALPSPSRLLLVDNDPAESARETAAELGVDWIVERTPGIAAARNAAVEAAGEGELLVMIDDDLVPEDGWLAGLVDTWVAHRPAAVMGYVRYVWPEGTDPWIAAGGFMRRTHFPTGTELSALSTGNVLLDPAQLRRLGVGFDVSLGTSGGSDLDLGHRLLRAGGRIVASAESIARDDIVPERTTFAFVKRRAIAQGQVRATMMSRDPDPASEATKRAGHLVGGLLRVPAFAAGEGIARLRGDDAGSAVYRRRRWFAQGRVLGALRRGRHEYARDGAGLGQS